MKFKPSCGTCQFLNTCSDRKKSPGYWCDSYRPDAITQMVQLGPLDSKKKKTKANDLDRFGISTIDSDYSEDLDTNRFNIRDSIEEAINSNKLVPTDLKLPERDFPEAPNFVVFCLQEKFLNVKPFVKQLEIAVKLFAEYCPRCTDTDYFMNGGIQVDDSIKKFRSKVALLEFGVCPHCNARKSELVHNQELNFYEELAVNAGQRGGKSALVAMMYAYIVHRIIKAQRLVDIYGLLNTTTLVISFTALTLGQVKIALWDPFIGYIAEAPWYRQYHLMLTEYTARHGEELFRLKDTFVLYKHRKLLVMMNTPDTNKMRGATRIGASIDEIGRFDNSANNTKIKINAQGVYEALQRSLRTVRSSSRRLLERGVDNILPGYFLNISSPSSYRDKICTLVRESQGSSKLLGFQLPTWELNPTVTREDLSDEFRRDPIGALCDYGAQPPLVSSPFIGSSTAVLQNCTTKNNPIKLAYRKTTRKDGTNTLYAYAEKLGKSGRASVLAIDAGEVNNSFALVGGSLDKEGKPRLDLFAEIQTRPGMKLNFTKIANELMYDIIDNRNVKFMAADQWQSSKVLSDVEDEFDIQTRKYSLKYGDMVNFRSYMEDKDVSYPRSKWTLEQLTQFDSAEYPKIFKEHPVEHFIAQCLSIQDTGSQVLKGENMTDDLWRAAALCHRMLVDEEVIEILMNAPDEIMIKKEIQIGMVKGFSGVSGNANNSPTVGESGVTIGYSKQRG
jgi:hypothetical protein